MSEMVVEFAGDFISAGASLEERRNRLNVACTAWNIACAPPAKHEELLEKYLADYGAQNPGESEEDLSSARNDLKQLIESKLRVFPEIQKQIVGAQISAVPGGDHIEVASLGVE